MGILERLVERRMSPTDLLNADSWSPHVLGSVATNSGVRISADTAMTLGVVYTCASVLSSAIASLPFPVLERINDANGRKTLTEQRGNPVWDLLNVAPVSEKRGITSQTAYNWRELMMLDVLLWGNHFSWIETNRRNEIEEIRRVPPWWVQLQFVDGRGSSRKRLWYSYKDPVTNEFTRPVPASDVLHVAGLGFDGIVGRSVIGFAREAIGLGLAAQEFGSRWFGGGSRPAGVFVHPKALSEEGIARLETTIKEGFRGLDRSHGTMVLEEGMKWEQIGVPAEDAQFLETKKYSDTNIAAMFKVPGHMVGIHDNQPRANAEQDAINFTVHGIMPWSKRIENETTRKLFIYRGSKKLIAKHNLRGLLRGDFKSTNQAFAIGRQGGWYSVNDIRGLLDMNPIDGGDTYMAPLNMVPLEMFDDIVPGDVDPNANKPPGDAMTSEQRSTVASTLHAAFQSAIERVTRKEAREIVKAEKRLQPDALEAWRTKFYADHCGAIDSAFRPIVHGICEAVARTKGYDSAEIAEVRETVLGRFHGLRAHPGGTIDPDCVSSELTKTILEVYEDFQARSEANVDNR